MTCEHQGHNNGSIDALKCGVVFAFCVKIGYYFSGTIPQEACYE